jgi:transketolase
VPVFDEDLYEVIPLIGGDRHPSYLRLGRGEPPKGFIVPSYEPWRQLCFGYGKTIIVVGPIASTYIEAFNQLPESVRPNLWAVAELPLQKHALPQLLLEHIQSDVGLIVVEEHVQRGGFGADLALHLLAHQIMPKSFSNLCAQSHTYNRYGSQHYLRKQSGLDVESICASALSSQ